MDTQTACQTCSTRFSTDSTDQAFYQKLQVPPPAHCPDCREQRRLAFRNDFHYYQRNCDLCRKNTLSLYHPSIRNVYCLSCFWSDAWDPQQYGQDFDFNRPFFEQYRQLLENVPKVALMNDNGVGSQNCEYTTDFAFGKNCYMVLSSWHDEDCYFGFQNNHDKNCIDNTFVNHSELMYECISCEKSYNCQYCAQCSESRDCIFGFDLRNCSDCILSAGLRNKSYCIWNVQYSKEEFLDRKKALQLDHWDKREEYKQTYADFLLKIPRKYANLSNCQDSTGDNLFRCKNAQYCFNFNDLWDCRYMSNGDQAKDSYDCNSTGRPELCYDCLTPDESYFERFSVNSWKSQYLSYCDNCHSCQACFGCVSLKRGQYCILNKRYSKEDYEALLPRIVEHLQKTGEWGNFFPPFVSLFAYNETSAQEWYPLNKEKAEALGYTWREEDRALYGKETLAWSQVPSSIFDCPEALLKEIFACLDCQRNYRILPQEFQFYKEKGIPLPRYCMQCRYKKRRARTCEKHLWKRPCMKCSFEVESPYNPAGQEIIYCETCYLSLVY